ncbi:MAG: isoprenylcysteine carboxylmethyltransferase family protein [Candidatus Methanoperedens sp.]|nr:isoprenylcysteine carboxylmethyltransferase family protein [Candidatus Methanoperedens sp.]MCZ7369778.1 isoprenylcysteine carboxylmethyltransferase family protein [Candidatus Methanoperedens sp.]
MVIITFIFYFLVFAVFHSALATDFVKEEAERLLGNKFRFYRIIYVIISLITFAPAFFIWIIGSTPLAYFIPGWLYPFFLLVRMLALGLFAYAAFQTDVLEFIGLRRSAKNELITTGAYGIVRHPLYAGGIILVFTKTEMSQLDLTAVLLVSIYLIIGAFIEEKRLLEIFGEEYRKYQNNVSMFIPIKWIMKLKIHR